jgi:flagellar basal body-associated protein FliL
VENRSHKKTRKSILDDIKLFQDAAARKKLTRWIMILVGLFIVAGGILLIVTLNMSEDIDNKGKHTYTW